MYNPRPVSYTHLDVYKRQSFYINARLEKDHFSTSEAGKLTVVVSGSGNFPLVTVPEIKWPAGFDAFDAKLTEDIRTSTVPLSCLLYTSRCV